ncbi:hypothetical protein K443DRAFT_681001 [Laccaria amethystina LaAM-08-1]|uniref:Uncharacterized protein n=1 Tax=Laccaria amethystina LaAM-08-1 TaxID=1095629 RepID=A0A0C9X9M7_9AGAR|nr:hypothetical protein K443DRAFT_681001 [Laccaria amethystina LaAM-08-1]
MNIGDHERFFWAKDDENSIGGFGACQNRWCYLVHHQIAINCARGGTRPITYRIASSANSREKGLSP